MAIGKQFNLINMNKFLLTIALNLGTSVTLWAQTNVGETGTVNFTYRGNTVSHTTVKAKDGRIWLQQNLGANRVATANNDAQSYGHYFQWGRWDDGHQIKETAPGADVMPTPNNPAGLNKTTGASNPFYFQVGTFIAENNFWGSGGVTDTWTAATSEDVTATNGCDPCRQIIGQGYRLPTKEEWDLLIASENITDRATAYSSNLKIPLAGYVGFNQAFNSNGSAARIWTSTADANGNAYLVRIQSGAPMATTVSNARASGLSVRCIYDSTLPVSFIDFIGKYKNGTINLEWYTLTEKDNAVFNVYKSVQGQPFKLIATVPGNGDSNSISKYYYTDSEVATGDNYYKLEQVDKNGSTTTLKYLAIRASLKEIEISVKVNADNFEIAYMGQLIGLDIYNVPGGKVLSENFEKTDFDKGMVTINNTLPTGIYILTCRFADGKNKTIKIFK